MAELGIPSADEGQDENPDGRLCRLSQDERCCTCLSGLNCFIRVVPLYEARQLPSLAEARRV